MVTKEEFLAYEDVCLSGVTNMFDIRKIKELSGLTRDAIVDIMKNYSVYRRTYLPEPKSGS
jgi:hypothetical protein